MHNIYHKFLDIFWWGRGKFFLSKKKTEKKECLQPITFMVYQQDDTFAKMKRLWHMDLPFSTVSFTMVDARMAH